MKYHAGFQYLPTGRERPLDDGETVSIEIGENMPGVLPMVGDFVEIQNRDTGAAFSGKVKSRLFIFLGSDTCMINIVVAETDTDWGTLIKE